MNAVALSQAKRGRKPTWPVIRERLNRKGISWRVDAGQFGGKARLVRQFPTLAEAEQYASDLRSQRAAQKEAQRFENAHRAVNLARLTDTQRADVLAAYRSLEGTRGTLAGCVAFWKAHAAPANARTVQETHLELCAAMLAANRRPRSIQEIRTRISGFVNEHGASAIASITMQDIETWMNERCLGLTARTRQHTRRVMHRLFSFAAKRGYREGNPVSAIEKPTAEETRPEVFKPAEVRSLLAKATELHPKIVPHLAIGLFAGLRASELTGLDWKNIDLVRREIHVDPAVAKKRRARYVKIEPNLLAWLAHHHQEEGPVYYNRDAVEDSRAKAKIRWPHNVMRHSFGSYHLANFEDAGRTAAQLGHAGDTSQLFAHYRALVRPDEAREYWKIEPTPAAILQFRKAATT